MAFYHPLLFRLDAERAHGLTIAALSAWGAAGTPFDRHVASPRLETNVAGIAFPNPLGLAAGVDKDARAVAGFFGLGFGSVEVGTLTPLPQPGNPRPRLFRLPEDRAVVNRFGFNNGGLDAALARLCSPAKAGVQTGSPPSRGYKKSRNGVLGLNVGANKDAADRIADYVHGVRAAAPLADYVTINISSPNTPGLRDLQGAALAGLLAACGEARGTTPLFLKVAPDLDPSAIDHIARTAIEARIDALIVGNTTVTRPNLRSANGVETGGLSGAPLAALAHQRLRDFRAATGAAIPLVAVGGIGSGAEAYARIRSGASLVQLYTALVYEGPGLAIRILRDLDALLARDGFGCIAEAAGAA